jgi:indolepyruvate ferredoxin oxidoreductase
LEGPTLSVDYNYSHAARFTAERGQLYLTAAEALLRLPVAQRQLDLEAGLNTAGYISGYPGSPLGGLDTLFRRQQKMLKSKAVHFEPGLNEDIAATAVAGTQYLNSGPFPPTVDGVFAMWYGKGPGLDRSADAIRTANFKGTSPLGGVLAVVGDDHMARSTVTAQQSETLFLHLQMPVFNPSSIQDYLDFGLAGWAMSRLSRLWVGFIALNDIADSAASVKVGSARRFITPSDYVPPPPFATPRSAGVGGALDLEHEMREQRFRVAQSFVRANGLDIVTVDARRGNRPVRGLGVIAAGKSYLDVRDGLSLLGCVDDEAIADLGISLYKPAVTYPLEPEGLLEFISGLDEVLVIEPKFTLMEDQVTRIARRLPVELRPSIVGKTDDTGKPLVPEAGGTDARIAADVLLQRIRRLLGDDAQERIRVPRQSLGLVSLRSEEKPELRRLAGFCAGCPHNTSTKLPDGTVAIGGTGCHGMAIALGAPDRPTFLGHHMGGEGALWIGMAPFTAAEHTFQNVGDGTYFHSGSLVVRAAVAASVNVTFKILLNGYISMTGGQEIPGHLDAAKVARQLLAEGVRKVAVVSDDVKKYRGTTRFPAGVRVYSRSKLIEVEEAIRHEPGVTAVVYDQACAAELRRRRRRNETPTPDKRVVINERVCEGCGDCNRQSNCISVEPVDTDYGRKRQINQSSCNQDFSCLDGYCPSFLTVYGATPKVGPKGRAESERLFAALGAPVTPESSESSDRPVNIVVAGIGGGGVLTVGGILGMAAHLEGRAVSVLNESGLAQKNGSVESHIRIAPAGDTPGAARIVAGGADVILAADVVVATAPSVFQTIVRDRTWVLANHDVRPTVEFVNKPSGDLSSRPMLTTLTRSAKAVEGLDLHHLALRLMGDAVHANVMMLGYALQRGRLPVSLDAVGRAIELNGVEIQANLEALNWGRLAAENPNELDRILQDRPTPDRVLPENLDTLVARRAAELQRYQDSAYAERYQKQVATIRSTEADRVPGHEELSVAVAHNLFKLMAYKDEYEVARLHLQAHAEAGLDSVFEPGYRYKINLAPQVFNSRNRTSDRARKWEIPSSVALPALRVLAAGRHVRGTRADLFGATQHRRRERRLISDYEDALAEIAQRLGPSNHALAVELASLPDRIRGYDTVKDEAIEQAEVQWAVLLDELRGLTSTEDRRQVKVGRDANPG